MYKKNFSMSFFWFCLRFCLFETHPKGFITMEEYMLLGVPQVTVLGPLLFVSCRMV